MQPHPPHARENHPWFRFDFIHSGSSRTITDLLFVFSISFLSLIWFRGATLVNPGDTNFCFFPINDLYRSLFQWDHQQGLGQADSMATAKIIPLHALMALLENVGLDLYLSQKVLFYLLFFLSGFSILLLINEIWDADKTHLLSRWAGISFYMMNGYLLQKRWGGGNLMTLFFHSVFPLMALFWWKARKSRAISHLMAMGLVTLFALPTLNNPAYLTPFLIFVAVDFLFCWGVRRDGSVAVLRRNALIGIGLFVPLFLFYFSAFYTTVSASLVNLAKSSGEFQQHHITSATTSFLNLFRFLGDWAFFENHMGDLYYPYSPVYNTPLFVFIGLGIAAVGLFATMVFQEDDRERAQTVLFFIILFLVGLWLMKGLHRPFGFLMGWAFQNVPLFSMFRDPMDKFGELVVLAFSVLLVKGLQNMSALWRGVGGKALTGVVFLGVHIYAWPFWTGDIWGKRVPPRVLSERRFHIPPDYFDFAKQVNSLPEKTRRVLHLPDNGTSVPGILSLRLCGSLYTGSDPLSRMIVKPLLYLSPFSYGHSDVLSKLLYDSFSEDFQGLVRELSALTKVVDVDSILYRGDMDNTTYSRMVSPLVIKKSLQLYPLKIKFGDLELYELPRGVDAIYRMRAAWIGGGAENWASYVWPVFRSDQFFPKDGLFFPDENPTTWKLKEELLMSWTPSWEKVTIPSFNRREEAIFFYGKNFPGSANFDFERVNPAVFHLRVRGAEGAFPVAFTESFHPGWKIFILPLQSLKKNSFGWLNFLKTWYPVKIKEKNPIDLIEFYSAVEAKKLSRTGRSLEWPRSLHWNVNAYGNVWWFDETIVHRLDREGVYFKRSLDGKIEFNAVIEFEPQKMGYLSAIVSGVTGVIYLGFLLFVWALSNMKRNKKGD